MQTIVKRIVIPHNKRIIVISDIHGHYYHLKNLLAKINFTEDDILFILGDIIEKGPLSLKTLHYVMYLCDNYIVYPLIGNVDAARLLLIDNNSTEDCNELFVYMKSMKKKWGSCLFEEMCSELEIGVNKPEDIDNAKKQMKIKFRNEFDFLYNLPTIIETQNYIFVHGGIPSSDINSFISTDPFQYLKIDAFMERNIQFNKYVVVGHWPVSLYNDRIACSNPIIDKKRKIISIDGGCGLKRDGQLNALVISAADSENITYQYYDDFPVAIAQSSQEESVDSISIRYTDNEIRMLEEGDEFSLVEHKSSGYCLWMHNDYIYSFDENTRCDDYTDYRISVNIGDKLSIVRKTSRGYLVKKNGVTGWYSGMISQ
ncbi:metallophosphoesterase [Clostridium oryzae]|uniref:Bis(5'-nucleosyl)-tetraphosphatase, symmetrical n=1 Tax=Clostridium oryzae TaxID=1450648 RepID=A0A1V4ILZ7_9CLOT|nr:metallophosphoesterase [Clostridium oryzae]OPJ60946.1 Bis(5'-nucleosyl)-tetraphosphatase, symmetrical [Clostridium oryzae]